MKSEFKALALLALALTALGGCGEGAQLRPPPGATLPVKPAQAARAPTTDELLTPPPIARPGRASAIDNTSQERKDDRFDLPPP